MRLPARTVAQIRIGKDTGENAGRDRCANRFKEPEIQRIGAFRDGEVRLALVKLRVEKARQHIRTRARHNLQRFRRAQEQNRRVPIAAAGPAKDAKRLVTRQMRVGGQNRAGLCLAARDKTKIHEAPEMIRRPVRACLDDEVERGVKRAKTGQRIDAGQIKAGRGTRWRISLGQKKGMVQGLQGRDCRLGHAPQATGDHLGLGTGPKVIRQASDVRGDKADAPTRLVIQRGHADTRDSAAGGHRWFDRFLFDRAQRLLAQPVDCR